MSLRANTLQKCDDVGSPRESSLTLRREKIITNSDMAAVMH